MDRQYEHIQELIARVAALEAQVQKLDRLVYKLFKYQKEGGRMHGFVPQNDAA